MADKTASQLKLMMLHVSKASMKEFGLLYFSETVLVLCLQEFKDYWHVHYLPRSSI